MDLHLDLFPETPSITLYDPLGELLGAGDGLFTYRFSDVVRLSGHACPTVVGAFLMVKRAMERLYPGQDEIPQRGDIRIRVMGHVDTGVNGPITQVFTLLTGAAADNGFQGLGGEFSRRGLLLFGAEPRPDAPFVFERISTGKRLSLVYSPGPFPLSPDAARNLPLILAGGASQAQRTAFQESWRKRVLDILKDDGVHTLREV